MFDKQIRVQKEAGNSLPERLAETLKTSAGAKMIYGEPVEHVERPVDRRRAARERRVDEDSVEIRCDVVARRDDQAPRGARDLHERGAERVVGARLDRRVADRRPEDGGLERGDAVEPPWITRDVDERACARRGCKRRAMGPSLTAQAHQLLVLNLRASRTDLRARRAERCRGFLDLGLQVFQHGLGQRADCFSCAP